MPRTFVAAIAAALLVLPALAHGPACEWCCGESDCFAVTGVATVTTPAPGYRLMGSIGEDGRRRPDAEQGTVTAIELNVRQSPPAGSSASSTAAT